MKDQPVKRRISSLKRDANRTKKVHLVNGLSEQMLSEQAGGDFCMEQSIGQPSSAEKSLNRKIMDKEIDFSRRYQDAKTRSIAVKVFKRRFL